MQDERMLEIVTEAISRRETGDATEKERVIAFLFQLLDCLNDTALEHLQALSDERERLRKLEGCHARTVESVEECRAEIRRLRAQYDRR